MNNLYVCDNCGHVQDLKGKRTLTCDICGGKLISQEEMKLREEAQDLIEKDMPDEDTTPEQDALEEVKDIIRRDGNDKVWHYIEEIRLPEARARERGLFLKAGGVPPEGQPFSI